MRTQKGFTLLELALVSLFIGLLTLFAMNQYTAEALNSVRAVTLRDISIKLVDVWSLAASTCNTPLDFDTSPLGSENPSPAANLSVLLGTREPQPAFQACFNKSGAKPLYGAAQGPSGYETIMGFPVSATVGDVPRTMKITFSKVPEPLALVLYNKMKAPAVAIQLPAQPEWSDPSFRYSGAGYPMPGYRDISLLVSY